MNKWLTIIVWPVMAAPLLYLAFAWQQLPEKIPMHFNLRGEADRMGDRQELLVMALVLSGMNLLVFLLLTNIHRIDPKCQAAENRDRLVRIAFATVVLLAAVLCFIINSAQQGSMQLRINVLFALVGLFFAFIGNYLPNLKPNYFAGLRLPWTLEDPDNWRKTHALAGKLWFAGGLLLALCCMLVPAIPGIVLFFVGMTALTIIPCVYSYRLYRSQKKVS